MLFNQLLDLIYYSKSVLSNNECDLFVKEIGNNTEYTINSNNTNINILEDAIKTELIKYFNNKKSLTKYNFISTHGLNISEFIIINKEYHNKFDVCYALSIYKYLMVLYFLDDNSVVTFFNTYTVNPKKGDVLIFPIAWFFVYKISKKELDKENVYIFNNVLKTY